jgi:hypothetical protein
MELHLAELGELALTPWHTAGVATSRVMLFALQGDEAAAQKADADAEEAVAALDNTALISGAQVERARAALFLGNLSAALVHIRRHATTTHESIVASTGGMVGAALGDQAVLEEFASLIDPLDQRYHRAVRDQFRGAAAAIAGGWDEAATAHASAIAGFEALEWDLDAALLGLESAAFLSARSEEARLAGEKAEAWFVEHGMPDLPRRYREAFKGTPAPTLAGARPGAAPRDPVPVDAEQPA